MNGMQCVCGGRYRQIGVSQECDTCGDISFPAKLIVVQENWFVGYEDGVETYFVPGHGVMDSYEIRAKGWKFWSDIED